MTFLVLEMLAGCRDQRRGQEHLCEAEAILAILAHCQKNEWTLTSSDMIDYELSRLTDSMKLQKIRGIYSIAGERITVTQEVKCLSRTFQQHGVKLLDSLHLALCEVYSRDILLTTDDNFIRAARRRKINTCIANPVTWLMEVMENER